MQLRHIVLLACLLATCTGCGVLTPRTSLQAGPFGSLFSFADTKDNDIQVDGAVYNTETHEFRVDKLVVRNNSSDPIRANVEQLTKINEQIRIHGENIERFMSGVNSFAATVAPWAARGSVNTPLGDVQIPAAVLDAAIQKALERIGPAAPPPAPSNP